MATDPCKAQPQRLNAMAGGVPTHIPQNGSRGLTLLFEPKKNWFPKRSNRSLQGAASALKRHGNRSLQGAAAAPKRNGRRRSNAHSAERFQGANVAFWIQKKLVEICFRNDPTDPRNDAKAAYLDSHSIKLSWYIASFDHDWAPLSTNGPDPKIHAFSRPNGFSWVLKLYTKLQDPCSTKCFP